MRRTRAFRGMGLVESLATLVVLSVLLGGLVLTSNSLRYGSAHEQTRSTLRRLRLALLTYQNKHQGLAPAGPTDRALAALLTDPDAAALLKDLDIAPDEHGRLAIRDGYGTPIRYLAPPPPPEAPEAPESPENAPPIASGGGGGGGGEVDFVSAGKDGQFAPTLSGAQTQPSPTSGGGAGGADDLYGSDTEGPTP